MALPTTTIGAYPKPAYVAMPDWFRAGSTTESDLTEAYNEYLRSRHRDSQEILDQATREVVAEQVSLGIEIPTDGEIRRENYIHYHCRQLAGFDFENLTEKSMRDGAWKAHVPTITGPIEAPRRFLVRDWQVAQGASKRPVKITLPGPLTIAHSVADQHYFDERALGVALAAAINFEVLALAEAGCEYIQIDEPVFARDPAQAIAFGLDHVEHCFHNVPPQVTRTLHICCGYPDQVDSEDYPKADPSAYFELAEALDYSSVQAVSIEDAYRPNDLGLLEKFRKTQVILGVIAIARTQVENEEEIMARLRAALHHIDRPRLLVGPDCGLGLLDRRLVVQKLKNMVTAAQTV
ncbi:MAG: cobalamin-independent methionine synthase II family protein [Anaerolineae bacterium]|nr:cobalamin-independent methionine synthase II family protein [Anaerolineae bacterium]